MKKSGSKEPAVEIAEPSSGKPMSVLKNKEEKLKTQNQNNLPEAVSTGPVANVDKINHAGDKPHEEKFVKFKGVKPKQKTVELKPTNEEAEQIDELSTDLLAKYKTAAGASAKAADKAGNYVKGDKRFKGINKATNKQFDNDLKKHGQYVKEGRGLADKYYALAQDRKATADENKDNHETYHTHMADHHDHMSRYHEELGQHRSAQTHADKADMHHEKSMERQKNKTAVKEDVYSSDTKTKKVQVQDKDGNWVFKDRKSHPHKINFGASRMNGKPDPQDPSKIDTETAYQKHLDKMEKQRNEAWVLNPDGKTKKKYKDIKDNKTLSISNTAPFDAFSNTNNQS